MREIVKVIPTEDYRLEIAFDDGAKASVDVKPLMKRKVFKQLKDKSLFRQVEIDHKFGGVQWPNGADVCIDWIEAELKTATGRKSTKTELISQIANKTKVPKKVVNDVLKSLIEAIRQTLKEERGITIPDLGTFSVIKTAARTGVNSRTGAKIQIAAAKAPSFRPAKALTEAVKESPSK